MTFSRDAKPSTRNLAIARTRRRLALANDRFRYGETNGPLTKLEISKQEMRVLEILTGEKDLVKK